MRRNPMLMTVLGANPGRKYQENPFVLIDSRTLKIIRNWKGSMMDRKPWEWAQEAARRLNRDVFVVAHPLVPRGFKAGVEVSKMFFAGGPWQVVDPQGGSREGSWDDLPRDNPSFGASVIGSMAGGLLANCLSNPAEGWVVTHDGETLKTFGVGDAGANAAFQWLLRHQGQSVSYAIKYGGYDIVLVSGGKVVRSFKRSGDKYYSNPASGPADETAARELQLYIENDADLYRQQFVPIVKNLMQRRAKGTYDPVKAIKLFMYLMDSGAKKYMKEFGTQGQRIDAVFNRATRLEAARNFRDSFETEAELGNYDRMVFGVSNNPRNPLTGRESAQILREARTTLRYGGGFRPGDFTRSQSAGQAMGMQRVVRRYGPKRAAGAAMKIKDRAQRVAGTTFSNPGPSAGGRKVTMPIARFAKIIRRKNDRKLWNDFVNKVKGYHAWTHGTWPTKVTVQVVKKAGVSGIWIAYDMGKEPEKTYIMPKGTKRKGAWKHPWETMPGLHGDPEAGIILTKMAPGNKITDFLRG